MPSTRKTLLTIGASVLLMALPLRASTAQEFGAQELGSPHALTRVALNTTAEHTRPLADARSADITLLHERRQLAAKLLSDDAAEMSLQLEELNDELAVLRHDVGRTLAELAQSYADLMLATGDLAKATDNLQANAVRADHAGLTNSQMAVDDAQGNVDVAQAGLDRARVNLGKVQTSISTIEQTIGDFEAIYAAERHRIEQLVTALSDAQVRALKGSLDDMAQAHVNVDIDSDDIQTIVTGNYGPSEIDVLVSTFVREARLAAMEKGPTFTVAPHTQVLSLD
jgi:hypothetical protein